MGSSKYGIIEYQITKDNVCKWMWTMLKLYEMACHKFPGFLDETWNYFDNLKQYICNEYKFLNRLWRTKVIYGPKYSHKFIYFSNFQSNRDFFHIIHKRT